MQRIKDKLIVAFQSRFGVGDGGVWGGETLVEQLLDP
jgi:hypothetical protein